jgi:TolA-binding protein
MSGRTEILRIALVIVLAVSAGLASPTRASALGDADRLWLVGERAFQDGLNALARRVLERFVERFPDDKRIPDATLLVGKARLATGALAPALDAFRKAQTFSPPPGKPEEARFWEGETLFRMKKFAEARGVYDRLLAENAASPMAPDALYGLGWAQVELKQRDAAVSSFRQLVQAFPDHQSVPSATVHAARLLIDLKRFEEAAAILRPFPERFPDHRLLPEARYLAGVARISSGQVSEGLTELRAVVTAYPQHEVSAQARRVVVDTLVRDGRKAELGEEYKSLVAQSPRTAEGLYDAGVIAARLGRARDADQAWLLLRNEFPEHPLATRAALDLAQGAFGKNAFKDAATLARAATKSPESATRAQAFLLVGESELRLKHFAPAHAAFQSAVESAGQDGSVRFRALAGSGLALEEQRQWAPAAKLYDEVAADSPDKDLKAWAKARRAAIAPNLKGGGSGSKKASPAPKETKGSKGTKP